MEELQQIPWRVVLPVLVALLGGLFGCILLLMKFPAARYLGKLLLGYAFLLLPFYDEAFPVNEWQILSLLVLVLYLYARSFFSQKNRFQFVHLIPVAMALGLFLTPLLVDRIIGTVVVIVYEVLIFNLLQKEAIQRGFQWFANPGSRVVWFRNFVTLNVVGLLFMLTGWLTLIVLTGFVLLLFVLVVYQSFKESEFLTPIPIGNKYQKSTLTPEIKAAVLDKIEAVMNSEFYLRDDATLSNLAKELGVTTHHLSQVLNESLQISFQDLIARYRIRKACEILRDEKQEQVKIESVAAMVGYNSKSSFNAAFKRRTGQTPTEYREAKSVRTYGGTPLSERERPSIEESRFSLNHVFNLKLNPDMIRFSLRNLRKHKLHSALNILGLSIGLSACLAITAYVHYELSYDRYHPDAENTYRIALNRIYPDYEKNLAITAPVLAPTLTDELPEVLNYTRVIWDDLMFGKVDDVMQEQRITAVDSGFFKVFDAKVISGSVDAELFKREDAVILTETAARKYFGDEDPVGEMFNLQLPTEKTKRVVRVEAVISDPLPNSHFSYEVLTVIRLMPLPPWFFDNWGTWGAYSYVKVQPGTDPVLLEEKINGISDKYQAVGDDSFDAWREAGNAYNYFLQPLTAIHLTSNLMEEYEANSSEAFVYFFALVGVFILLMAVVNFVNLATARASYRTLEVGIRKAVGASRVDLMSQFLLESTVISVIALLIALPVTQMFLPRFNEIIGKSLSLTALFSPANLMLLILTPFVLGILSGFYPALYLSNFGPAAVFQKLIVRRGKESLRHLLVVGQFVVAVVLIAATVTVFRQMHYMSTKPLGFDKDQLIKIDKLPFIGEKIQVFKQEAMKISGVRGVSVTNFPIDGIRAGSTVSTVEKPDNWVNTNYLTIDEHFIDAMGIQVIAGRNFLPEEIGSTQGTERVLLNKSAVHALGVRPDEIVNQPLNETIGVDVVVIGVTEDFNYGSLHNSVHPLQLSSYEFEAPFRSATIRLDPRERKAAIAALNEVWSNLAPDKVFDFDYMDEALAQYYEAERLTGKLFIIFSGFGIFVCCLGLFGLMGYVVEQRSKEVGIRKVMGARIRSIVLLLSRDYIRLVLISSVIAIPISWWGLNQWLEGFTYRIENSIWIFLLAGLLVSAISWCTVAVYAFQAAKANPVESLRNE